MDRYFYLISEGDYDNTAVALVASRVPLNLQAKVQEFFQEFPTARAYAYGDYLTVAEAEAASAAMARELAEAGLVPDRPNGWTHEVYFVRWLEQRGLVEWVNYQDFPFPTEEEPHG